MSQANRYTKVAVRLGERLAANAIRAEKAKPIPFGMEKVTAAEQDRRFETMRPGEFQTMSPEDRRNLVNEYGLEAVMQKVRQIRGA